MPLSDAVTHSSKGALDVQFENNATVDAFARLRVSEPTTLFDSKQIFDKQPLFWDDQEVSGGGTGSSHSTAEAATTISVGATTAGKRTRQTFMRFNYQPGKSQLALLTFSEFDTATGITKSAGLFDDNNGIFFKSEEGTLKVVRRSKVTGSVVDTEVSQSDWSVDPLDGTGPSRITLDPSKTQIAVIDLEWLGVGRVRVGFNINGNTIYVHEFLNANNLATVYMSTPNLPLRYSIENDGNGAADDFVHICSSVVSEGGTQSLGSLRAYNMGSATVNANTVDTNYALLGIRLKAAALAGVVNIERMSVIPTTSDRYIWELRLNPTVAGTFTYSDETNSVVQIAEADTSGNPSTNTVTGGTLLDSGYGVDSQPIAAGLANAIRLGSAIDGTADEIVLSVIPMSINLDIHGSLTWRELS